MNAYGHIYSLNVKIKQMFILKRCNEKVNTCTLHNCVLCKEDDNSCR